MTTKIKDNLKAVLSVSIGLAVILVPFSMLIGWNLVTLFVFWFAITPGLTIYLPAKVSGNQNHLFESLAGMVLFYAVIVFMIYDHYQTDYFQIMILSFVINTIFVSVFVKAKRPGPKGQLSNGNSMI